MRVRQAITVETAPSGWTMLVVLLAGLASAIPACRVTESEETALGDGAVTPEAAKATDVSISPDASPEADGDQPRPDVDGSVNDGTNVPEADGVGGAAGPTRPVEGDAPPPESVDPTDAGTEDSDGAMPDAAMPDAAMPDGSIPDGDGEVPDAAVPDGSEPIVPLFATCAYMPSIQHTPYAIIEASPAPTGLSSCHCSGHSYALTYRVLCGSYTPPAIVSYNICPMGNEPNGREIYIVDAFGCRFEPDAATGMWLLQHRPVSDWDALLAEQIAGHADSGGHD
jgi:hypothetical protein